MCPYCDSDINEQIHEGSNYLMDDPTIYKCKVCGKEFTEDEIETEEDSDEQN